MTKRSPTTRTSGDCWPAQFAEELRAVAFQFAHALRQGEIELPAEVGEL